jgi:hypothetical protein
MTGGVRTGQNVDEPIIFHIFRVFEMHGAFECFWHTQSLVM